MSRTISAGVVQESDLGPPAFVVCASVLHPVNEENQMATSVRWRHLPYGGLSEACNYRGNCKLSSWARESNLQINNHKSREKIITRRGQKAPVWKQ